MKKRKTLARHLGIKKSEVKQSSYDDCTFDAESGEYLVLTDSEADERAKDYIRETIWAFNPYSLSGFTDLPEEVFEALQPQCESANDAILKIIGDQFEDFAEQAISADGRGHFMSSYDGEEHEEGDYFIYRIN